MVRNDTEQFAYHQDVLGNVVLITDSSGQIAERYEYDAFGKATIRDGGGDLLTNSAVGNRFLFTAREYDAETGLHYYRARSYSADLGRFLQLDPIDFDAGDVNLYRYVGNDPVNWVDPRGESAGQIAVGMRDLAGHTIRSLPRGWATAAAGVFLGLALILESLEENAEEGDECGGNRNS